MINRQQRSHWNEEKYAGKEKKGKKERERERERENKRKNRRQNETLERLLGRINLGYANKFLRNVNYRS